LLKTIDVQSLKKHGKINEDSKSQAGIIVLRGIELQPLCITLAKQYMTRAGEGEGNDKINIS